MSRSSPLETIFFECLSKDTPEERAAYLAHACAGDSDLLRRVRQMLEAQSNGFLEQAAYVPELSADSAVMGERAGQRIGAYELVERIGEGGMGTVWRADQRKPVRRQVALKLIKAGMDSRQVLARFETERQALALMDHPNIARVLDGGTDDAGRPYFVMDLFAGVPITRYCDERRLAVRQRLELFIHVCEAIQHAHQKGVIHRDIKPSNVLVAMQDGRAVPKVIDFGLAKATAQDLIGPTVLTQQGGFVGTLEYMSPEQAVRSAGGVDTRTDIYSLGALLYELLTGTTPLSLHRLEHASYEQILRAITYDETRKPSSRLTESGEALAMVSAVRGELDWIVMKALEKDRERRYSTAAEFAQDVQRFLVDEPVLACPPSTGYLVKKFVRRHRGALATASVVTVALLVGIGGIGWAMRDRAAQAAETARLNAERQARVTATVQQLLVDANRQLATHDWQAALATVRRAEAATANGEPDADSVRRVHALLRDLELVQRLEDMRTRQSAWVGLQFDSAAASREYAQAFREHGIDFDEMDVETAIGRLSTTPALTVPLAAALDDWATKQFNASADSIGWKRVAAVAKVIDPEPTRNLIRTACETPDAGTPDELQHLAESIELHTQHPATLVNLARTLKGFDRPEAALRLLRDAQRLHPADFWLNLELGAALELRKDVEGAIRYSTAAVALRPDSAAAHNNLGNELRLHREVDAALACFWRAIELDPTSIVPRINRSRALLDQRKWVEALASVREAVELGPKDAQAWISVGTVLRELRQPDEAVDAFRRAIELEPKNAYALSGMSDVLHNVGKVDEAITCARQAIAADARYAGGHMSLGNALSVIGRFAESAEAHRTAIEIEPDNAVAHCNLGNVLNALHDPSTADEALAMCRKAIELDPELAIGYAGLGNLMIDRQETDQAIAAYRKALELDPTLGAAYFNLGQALYAVARMDEAMTAYQKAVEVFPSFDDAYWGIGLVHSRRHEWNEAREVLRKAADINPQNPRVQYTLSQVLTRLGQFAEAIAAFEQSLRLDSANAGAASELAWLLATCPDANLRNGPRAVELARQALSLEPTNDHHQLVLGAAHCRTGNWQDALDALHRASQHDPTTRCVNGFLVAMAAWRLDDEAGARSSYADSVRELASIAAAADLRGIQEEAARMLGVGSEPR